MTTITYACGHKDTLTHKPSPQRRRSLRKNICHDCYVRQAQRERDLERFTRVTIRSECGHCGWRAERPVHTPDGSCPQCGAGVYD